MTAREPAWRRALRRPLWRREYDRSQGIVVRYSDLDPWSTTIQAANRVRVLQQANLDKARALLDRLDNVERSYAERQRAERLARYRQR